MIGRWFQRQGLLALYLASAGVSACGGPAHGETFLVPFRAAQRAQSAGRYEEAAEGYLAAAEGARRLKDRDEALFMRARMLERAERWEAARAAYRQLVARSPDGPRTARASYDAAYLQIEHGDTAAGWRQLRVTIERHPDHGSSRRALERWCDHTADTEGEAAVRAQLARWQTALADTSLAQRVAYERARSHERAGEKSEARAAYLAAARLRPYPRGNLTDDSYWHASELALELGDADGALDHLRELLKDRENATGGSYNRPRYPSAQLRIGEVYRDHKNDLGAARYAFAKTYGDYPDSILADDARWQEARAARAMGDGDAACRLARALKDADPDSRYIRCLDRICDEIAPASRPCPDYIAREL